VGRLVYRFLFRGSGLVAVLCLVTVAQPPLVVLIALQSIIDITVAGYWLPAPAMCSLFPRPLRGIPSNIGPRQLAKSGSSSHELHLTFRVFAAAYPPGFLQAPLLRFRPSS